ncbi:hypothetical protein ACE1SV_63340 [Streptomyces sp. E-15]
MGAVAARDVFSLRAVGGPRRARLAQPVPLAEPLSWAGPVTWFGGGQLMRSDQPAGRSPGATEMTESSSAPTYSKRVIFANSGTT